MVLFARSSISAALSLLMSLTFSVSSIKVYTNNNALSDGGCAIRAPVNSTPLLEESRRDFTICMRINLFRLQLSTVPFKSWEGYEMLSFVLNIHINEPGKEDVQWLGFGRHWFLTVKRLVPKIWNHLCLSYGYSEKRLRAVMNGEVIQDTVDKKLQPDYPLTDLLRTLEVGCSFKGEVSDVNAWTAEKDLAFMNEWTTCKRFGGGEALEWNRSNWVLGIEDMTERLGNEAEFCSSGEVPGWVLVPEKSSFHRALHLCESLKSEMVLPTSEIGVETLIEMVTEESEVCNAILLMLFVAATDEKHEGNWTSVYSGAPIPYKKFLYNFPDGGEYENCAIVDQFHSWNDFSCDRGLCFACDLLKVPTVRIRGMCLESSFDLSYSWIKEKSGGQYQFQGWVGSDLKINETSGTWMITPMDKESPALALSNVTSYPFGKKLWQINNDSCYGDQNEKEVFLKICSCDSTEFCCDDGACVPMGDRCNSRPDCEDNSDEIGCSLIEVDERTYLMERAPLARIGSMEVVLDVDIYNILDMNEVAGTFRPQFVLFVKWYDPRLKMFHLRQTKESNLLSNRERDKIWVPVLTFANTEKKDSSINDGKTHIYVERKGEHVVSPTDQIDNSYIFQGSDNQLVMSRIYNNAFLCQFQLANYPFDVQHCTMIFTMEEAFKGLVEIVPGNLLYLGNIDLKVYYIEHYDIHSVDTGRETSSVEIRLVFSRRLLGIILTTYMPTLLLIIIVLSTHHFKPQFFQVATQVNVTVMLVMTTMYVGTSSSLPATSYVKMIDIWMIFCLAIPFSQLLVRNLIEICGDCQDENEKDGDPSKWARSREEGENLAKEDDSDPFARRRMIKWYLTKCSSVMMPWFVVSFVAVYFVYGIMSKARNRHEVE